MNKLAKYLDTEKSFDCEILQVKHYFFSPDDNFHVTVKGSNSMFIIVNQGHLIIMEYKNDKIFCPAKSGILGFGKRPKLFFNNKNSYDLIILELTPLFSKQVNKKLFKLLHNDFRTIFQGIKYVFTFTVNIKILDLLDDLTGYRDQENSLVQLDVEATFLRMLSDVLQIIFFKNYRVVNNMATVYTKYFLILKQILEGALRLEDALDKYQMKKGVFLELLVKLNPTLSHDRLLNGYKTVKK